MPTITEEALDFLNSLAPLARVDRIDINPYRRQGELGGTDWLVTATLWGRTVLDDPPGAVAAESSSLTSALTQLARTVHDLGMDQIQRQVHPDYEMDRDIWEGTRERNPSLKPLPEPYLGPIEDPEWDPASAVASQTMIAYFERSALLSRAKYGNLDEPTQLWIASTSSSTAGALFGKSPFHALVNVAMCVPQR